MKRSALVLACGLAAAGSLAPQPAQAAATVSVSSPSCGALRMTNGTSAPVDVETDGGAWAELQPRQSITRTGLRGGEYVWMAYGVSDSLLKAKGYTNVASCKGVAPRPLDGDQNNDRKADVLGIQANTGNLYYYKMTATGLAPGVKAGTGWNSMLWMQQVNEVEGAATPNVLLAVRKDGAVFQYANLGAGRSGSAKQVGKGLVGYSNFTVLPLNNPIFPGMRMLLASKGDVLQGFVMADGMVDTEHPMNLATGWSTATKTIAVRNFDNDRLCDIISIRTDGSMQLHRINTDFTKNDFLMPPVKIGSSWGAMGIVTSPGSLNGDHLSDLVSRRNDGNLYKYVNQGARWGTAEKIGANWNGIRLLA